MRILYISNNSSSGGAPAALLNLVRQLSHKHEIAVVMPDSNGPLYRKMRELGITCHTSCAYGLSIWPKVVNPVKYISRLIGLRCNRTHVREYIGNILDEFNPDIVHTNVGPLDIAEAECRKRGIPHVWHLREYQKKDFGMTYFPGGRREFMSLLRGKNYHCIAITKGVYDYWSLDGDSKVIYDGVFSVGEYEPVIKGGYFMYAARIEKGKGLHTLLKAYRRYVKDGGTIRLLVAGRPCGYYARLCMLYARLSGLTPMIDFLGNRDDIYELMRGAEALVVPSRFEGFGFTTAEAMYNRCLVIGKDTAGTKEQFDNGLKITGSEIGIRFNNVRELTDSLFMVQHADGSFEDMKDKAYTVVSRMYTVERYAEQIEKYYETVR